MGDKFRLFGQQHLLTIFGVSIVLTSLSCQSNVAVQSEVEKRSHIISLYQQYAQEFPQVESITVKQLQQLQQQDQKLHLIDVRSPKEREVSIIPGAITQEELENNLEQYKHSKSLIIAYCTIGYRSGKYAEKLSKQGINILNLQGGLLAWSHIQGKLVARKITTKKVYVLGRQKQLTAIDYQPIW
jgi:rhodanese-related sulfurtransferase